MDTNVWKLLVITVPQLPIKLFDTGILAIGDFVDVSELILHIGALNGDRTLKDTDSPRILIENGLAENPAKQKLVREWQKMTGRKTTDFFKPNLEVSIQDRNERCWLLSRMLTE